MRTCPKCQRTYADDMDYCPRDGAALILAVSGTQAELESSLAQRFRIIRRLGAGGMGTVFLAEQIAVGNRPVALKILLRKLIDDPEFLLRFQNEAASTGRIRHANVVTIYESGQADDGSPYIAMEYLEGESLRQALKRRGSLPVAECVDILQQAARGLNAAHKLGIIHRDLKPDNIFLTLSDDEAAVAPVSPPAFASPLVKIVDFGIAKLRESATHTLTGTVLGTPAYMSFEQASGMKSEELDARSDVYSLGIVAYEMLTGRVPFHSDTPLGYVRKHLSEEPPPFRAVKPGLGASPALENVVMKALTKDREARYGSVLEFARAFAEAAKPAAVAIEPPPPLPSTKIVRPVAAMSPSPQPGDAAVAKRAAVGTPPLQPPQSPQRVAHLATMSSSSQRTPQITAPKPRLGWWIGVAFAVLGMGFGGWYEFSVYHNGTVPIDSAYSQKVAGTHPTPTSAPPTSPSVGTVWQSAKDGLNYVWIPTGSFMMGCSPGDSECGAEEKPSHQVTISKGYWLGQTPVTVAAYRRYAGTTGKAMPQAPGFNSGWNDQEMPIVNVSWNDSVAFCTWGGGRLPTEAEWEYAARAGSTKARYGPIDDVAWYWGNSGGKAHDVGQKRTNAWNLYDMLGNVWEWVNDWYDEKYYQNGPSQDPTGPGSGQLRVLRGGSWGDVPRYVRVSGRYWVVPVVGYVGVGVRCAREVGIP